jgi:hypothetical protein
MIKRAGRMESVRGFGIDRLGVNDPCLVGDDDELNAVPRAEFHEDP